MKEIKLQSLRRKFEMMQMEDEQKIVDYISKLNNVVNQMKACGETIYDHQIKAKFHFLREQVNKGALKISIVLLSCNFLTYSLRQLRLKG